MGVNGINKHLGASRVKTSGCSASSPFIGR